MTRAGVPQAKIDEMWRAYQKHQTAFYVARIAHVSAHTAAKYIDSANFVKRFSKLRVNASEIADEAQADILAGDLVKLNSIKRLLSDALLAGLKNETIKPTITELDRLIRLIAFIRGEPEQHIGELYDFSWIEEEREREESRIDDPED